MTELKEILDEHHAIVSFNNDEIEMLGQIAEIVDLEQGEVLYQEQDTGDSIYLVVSGAVNLYTCLSENLEQTIMTVRSGGFVGAMAMLEDDVRGVNAKVTEETKAYKFDRSTLNQYMDKGHSLGIKLLRLLNDILSKRLRIAINSLRQNLEWTMQVSGLVSLNLSQLIVDQVNIEIDLVNGKQLDGIIMKAEEQASGFELFIKTNDGKIHFVPYHAIVSASLPVDAVTANSIESSSL